MTEITNNLNQVQQVTNPSQAKTDRKALIDNFDTFLKLLTTQLKYQDPSEPMDTNEFTHQIVMFSQAEQALATNEKLKKLIDLQAGSQLDNLVSYLGNEVEAKGDAALLNNSFMVFAYDLPEAAREVSVSILDSTGTVVYTQSGSTTAGRHEIQWDGVNSITNLKEPDGTYRVAITAVNPKGNTIENIGTRTIGVVTAVEGTGQDLTLSLNGRVPVTVDDIVAVRHLPGSVKVKN
jgi:flagellar basal-body rod modification protein FlgD